MCSTIHEACKTQKVEFVPVQYFKQGQVLMPDYAIPDTLVVTDADGLNKAIAPIEQGLIDGSDKSIADTFYKYCKKFNGSKSE